MNHDYPRVWRRLKPAELDKRITLALSKLTSGQTLRQVGEIVGLDPADLCRVLIHYAPKEWRIALTARALLRHEDALNDNQSHSNTITRARIWATGWHLSYALDKLAKTELRLRGHELCGQCPDCKQESAYAPIGTTKPARCYKCGWEGDAKAYCLSRLSTDSDVDGA